MNSEDKRLEASHRHLERWLSRQGEDWLDFDSPAVERLRKPGAQKPGDEAHSRQRNRRPRTRHTRDWPHFHG